MSSITLDSTWLKENYTNSVTLIKKGTWSSVYSFTNPKDSNHKALKVISLEAGNEWTQGIKTFKNRLEKQKGNKFVHPIDDYNIDEENHLIYIVSELAEENLSTSLSKAASLPKDVLNQLLENVIGCLLYENEKNIKRGYFSPLNILKTKAGFVLSPMGPKKNFKKYKNLLEVSAAHGTITYMAPELLTGIFKSEYTEFPNSEVYSLGLVLLNCCGVSQDRLLMGLNKTISSQHDTDIYNLYKYDVDKSLRIYLAIVLTACFHGTQRAGPLTIQQLVRSLLNDNQPINWSEEIDPDFLKEVTSSNIHRKRVEDLKSSEPGLLDLDLHLIPLSEYHILYYCNLIKELKNVERVKLWISHSDLSNRGFFYFVEALGVHKGLKSLTLWICKTSVNDIGFEALTNYLSNLGELEILVLLLDKTLITDISLPKLSKSLSKLQKLKEIVIDLSEIKHITERGLQEYLSTDKALSRAKESTIKLKGLPLNEQFRDKLLNDLKIKGINTKYEFY